MAGLVVVAFGALVALTLLGRTAHTELRRVPSGGDRRGTRYIPLDDDAAYPVNPGGASVDDPIKAVSRVCPFTNDIKEGATPRYEFNHVRAGGDDQFAQVVRIDDAQPTWMASIDLRSGEALADSDDPQLERMGRLSTVVVCLLPLTPVPRPTPTECTYQRPDAQGVVGESKENVYPGRRNIRVYEISTGHQLATGFIDSVVSACPPDGADFTGDVDVTDEQVTSWVVDHMTNGTFQ